MVAGTHRFAEGRSALRAAVSSYVNAVGPGGLVSYAAPQDLLIVTDFNSALLLKPAELYVRPHKLRAVVGYTHHRRELPGAHILDVNAEYPATDIRYQSTLSNRSMYALDLMALVDAQANMQLTWRRHLLVKSRSETLVTLCDPAGLTIPIGTHYYDALLYKKPVRMYSGVYDSFQEPTNSWKNLPVEKKGVFFTADSTFYGLVMPHAKHNSISSENRDSFGDPG